MIKVLSLTLTFAFLSCANTQIKSTNKIPLSFNSKESLDKEIDVTVTKEFFLWGMLPSSHEIEIDDVVANRGYNQVSDLVIEQENRTSDVVWTLLTFGVYYPQTFRLKGKGTIK